MKRLLRHPIYLLILFGLLVSMIAKADTWGNPSVKTYYSDNKEFKLIITPKRTSDKYYLWNYYKSNNHPQTKKILRKKKKFMQSISAQDTVLIPCKGELYMVKGTTDSVLIWERTLLNDICPTYAIVANDGSSIATFDNWYSTGYGVNVFVVYDEKGNARKTYKLEEISPFPLNDYSMSISSLFWRKNVHYIDNDCIEIIFETDENKTTKRIYNLNRLEFE
ncbi:hypothetical protein [Proteiniphilum propionicum]|jgi:hypothetical protein|uniref:hypothetical protein n=1 Tax=Proteiniphilum propionicum TaxID=2829812 RepID=UPI001EEB4EDD|nr:hypothetical protein [Proteiniphilum propionicum]ULB35497.1 hypothetical protein KDN43_05530 [Proteiniphilum propionicum]